MPGRKGYPETINLMKSAYIYIILLIIIVAGIFYLFGGVFGGDPVQVRRGRLIDIEPGHVMKGIYIRSDSTRVVFERSGKRWVVTHPVRTSGAINIVDDLIENISESKIMEVIEGPADLSEFGLKNPSSVIILYQKGREKPDTIRIGSRAPTSNLLYASIGSSRDVYLSNEIITQTAEKTLFHFRNKKFININPNFISRIEHISDSREFAIINSDLGWKLEGTGIPAREKYISGYIQTLDRMLIYRFIPATDENLEKFGLVIPDYIINIDSYEKNIHITFGSRMADMIHATRNDMDQIFLVRTDLLRIFSESYKYIFDLSVSRFKRDEVRLLAISGSGTELRLRYFDGGWTLAGGGAAEDEIAETIIENLKSLEYETLPVALQEPPSSGDADLVITIEGRNDSILDKVIFFQPRPGKTECWSLSGGSRGPVPPGQYRAVKSAAEGI
ncbi:MAG: DUF4340 domain-containing protein [Candidatus Krumholzibacteriales bacterium]